MPTTFKRARDTADRNHHNPKRQRAGIKQDRSVNPSPPPSFVGIHNAESETEDDQLEPFRRPRTRFEELVDEQERSLADAIDLQHGSPATPARHPLEGAGQVQSAIKSEPPSPSVVTVPVPPGEHKKRKAAEGGGIIPDDSECEVISTPHTPNSKRQRKGDGDTDTENEQKRPQTRFDELFDEQERSLAGFRDAGNDIKSLQLEPHPTSVIDSTEGDSIEKALIAREIQHQRKLHGSRNPSEPAGAPLGNKLTICSQIQELDNGTPNSVPGEQKNKKTGKRLRGSGIPLRCPKSRDLFRQTTIPFKNTGKRSERPCKPKKRVSKPRDFFRQKTLSFKISKAKDHLDYSALEERQLDADSFIGGINCQ